jgi:hypothetical protein
MPHPGAQSGVHPVPHVHPTQEVSVQPRPSPKNRSPATAPTQQQQQQRPPPPPEPAAPKAPRVRVAFEDADSDDERLARHDTLANFDLDDVHEISDHDFAELDDGNEQGVQDAGIMEGDIPVQPAITLKDTTSRESTSVPVQSIAVDTPVGGSFLVTLKEQPVPQEESVKEPNAEPTDDEKTSGQTQSTTPSRQNSMTPQKRRSTFGALLGAAAAMFSGSNRKLETTPSKKGSQLTNAPSAAASPEPSPPNNGDLGESKADEEAPRPFSTITEEEYRPSVDLQSPPSLSDDTKNEAFSLGSSAHAGPASRQSSLQNPQPQQEATNKSNLTLVAGTTLAAGALFTSTLGMAAAAGAEASTGATNVPGAIAITAAASGSAHIPSSTDETPPPKPPKPQQQNSSAALTQPTQDIQTAANGGAAPEDEFVVAIKVRTLAGKAAIFEVDKTMTLFEFRDLIQTHFSNIPIEEQRLLYKGKMIEVLDPATTLETIGFKTNDLVHLVRTLANKQTGQHSPNSPQKLPSSNTNSSISLNSAMDDPNHLQQQQQQQTTPNSQLQMLTVLVPPGRGPGDRLRILPQGRGAMLVTVPAGVFAGDRFRVLLPPEDPAEMQRAEQLMEMEQMRQQELLRQQEAARQSLKPQIMAVVVPKGFRAGQVMDVNIPGRGRVRVTIPNGVKAGQQFKFRLPN